MRLNSKVIFIAGASGMAAATARMATEEGAHVFAVDRNQETLDSLKESLHGFVGTFCADLTLGDSVDRSFADCLNLYGRVDAVFFAAGLSGRRYGDGALHECTLEGWQATIANNSTAAFLVNKRALNYFLSKDAGSMGHVRGTILNMASVLAYSPQRDHFGTHAYSASKGAVIAMTRAAAAYYAPLGININAIAPGLVTTPMSKRSQEDPVILEYIRRKQPLVSDLLDPEDVAHAAIFLLSDEARYMTGQIIGIDGGWAVTS